MKHIKIQHIVRLLFLILLGIILIYPFIWLVMATFKTNQEIFGSLKMLPSSFGWDAYIDGWKTRTQFTFTTFYLNSFMMVAPTVLFTVISSALVAYGFARFQFPFKNLLFFVMISTLMLPNTAIIIPRYVTFLKLGWLNTYYPFIIPALLACNPFFIFMMIQFFRGIPRELDESAYLDGCSSFGILLRLLLPLSKPALISAALLQTVWTWNDFFNSYIFISAMRRYTVSLAVRMSLDSQGSIEWKQIMAMAVISMLPCIVLFVFAQKYFVEGIATTGLKG